VTTVISSPNKFEGRRAPIRLVVLHTMESPETAGAAEAVGRIFANPARHASTHVGVDTDSTVRYVSDDDTAWAAPGANADGLHIELAGRAGQTARQWADASSEAILERAAHQVATWCRVYGIPARWLTHAQLADGRTRGIIGHADASAVFKLSDHTDPGRAFPRARFLARVKALIGGPVGKPQTRPSKAPRSRIRLAVDGDFGPRTKARLQQWAGTTVDSTLSARDWRAIQRKVRVVADGIPGPQTWRGIQRLVKVTPDGVPGPVTYRALQAYLNRH
jgi:hypothetical protein